MLLDQQKLPGNYVKGTKFTIFCQAKKQLPISTGKLFKATQTIPLPFKVEPVFYAEGPYSTGWAVHYIEHGNNLLKEHGFKEGYIYLHLLKAG